MYTERKLRLDDYLQQFLPDIAPELEKIELTCADCLDSAPHPEGSCALCPERCQAVKKLNPVIDQQLQEAIKNRCA
ncbi:MAG: hypothetical protein MUE40_22010 [Anaerolineae bacterium]|nr:hypothetical protein [Anaerolineae bacterium]